MNKKIKILRLSFKSYIKFIFLAACCLCVFWMGLILLVSVLSVWPNDVIKFSLPQIKFSGKEIHGPITWVLLLIFLPFNSLIQAISIAILSFLGFNLILKILKGIRISVEYESDSTEHILIIKKFSLSSLIKLLLAIALPTGVIYGLIVFLGSLFKHNFEFIQQNIISWTISGPWWSKIYKVITSPIEFSIDSIIIAILLYWLYNLYLSKFNGLKLFGEYQKIN